jgi:hypothetical protein
MRINLDPKVEQDEHGPTDPTQDVKDGGMTGRGLKEGEGKEEVGEEVVEEDHVDEMAEHDPDLLDSSEGFNERAREKERGNSVR